MKDRFLRQSFLGTESEKVFYNIKVGVVGLCGGGSPICQQLAHLGVRNYVLVDDDIADDTNLNRLIGVKHNHPKIMMPKVNISEKLIKGILPTAKITKFKTKWQMPEASLALRGCSVIFGCVDSLIAREQLERFCRRFMIIYIDLGMDVHKFGDTHSVQGQVCLSLPQDICMRCMGVIYPDMLTKEAKLYGAAGGRPQVVWSNGMLASQAIQVFIQLITSWNGNLSGSGCWEYDGNHNTVSISGRISLVAGKNCTHYNSYETGDEF
jgi:hypothetical protein